LPEHDTVGDALERLEWIDKRSEAASRAAQITRRTALTGGAAGLAAALLEACGASANGGTTSANTGTGAAGALSSIFGAKGGYRFTFVNHATANSFFVPTVSGIQDACQLLNCSYQWVGSNSGNVGQMADAINTAISARVDGIATTLISPSLAKPVAAAAAAGIPVLAYNADDPKSGRLAYIGQNLTLGGREMGERIRSLIPGGGRIMVFIATPGTSNLQPRLDGITSVLAGSGIEVHSQASGAGEPQEDTSIDAFIGRHMRSYHGYFAVDAGSTAAVGLAIKKYNLQGKVVAGGFDLIPDTQELLYDGFLQFAIDQQPYLQGFLATLELFLYKATQHLTGAADVDTGAKFYDPRTIRPFYETKSRYEGTGTSVGVRKSS
jgi:simple sugar transport system substrate-binding protein